MCANCALMPTHAVGCFRHCPSPCPVVITRIVRHNSLTILQCPELQNWVSNCSSWLLLGSLTLKMKAVRAFEMSSAAYQSPRRNFSENFNAYFICSFMSVTKFLYVDFQSDLNSDLFDVQLALPPVHFTHIFFFPN